ncbi:HlyD family secretion protein [Pullulanibacillus pueri]|uniref:HlyD family secretion protein n=1 Tax=Pullulanibacillus pueri TaxID=1437324 RepID=A0A8J3A2H8_9BACL|nr:HlyD family efflux transporter periplasmic adaptor subunit [Pullulanibacillus pueri]MBM7684214.1 HlyD family secretion protein [Pullulanibacillus pueri]GGH88983.1 hypothetical protein GCM10007096_42550 [Pullulanibacillus pueri]
MKKWIIVIIALILVAGAGTTWYVTKGESKEIVAINRTATVKKGTIETKVTGSGSLTPTTDKDITVTEGNTVDEVLVSNGDTVKKGEDILSYTDGTVLEAPAAGTISDLQVYEGSRINAGQVVAHLTNYSDLSTVISVDELDIPEVKVGQTVNITVNAYPDKKYTGTVKSVAKAGTVNNGVSTFDVTVRLKSSKNLKSGMTTTAEIITNKVDNVLYVPVDAIHKNGDSAYVLVPEQSSNATANGTDQSANGQAENNNAKQVEVKTGAHNDNYIEIKSGLEEGQTVQLPQITMSQSGNSNGDQKQNQMGPGGFGGGNFGGGNFGGGNFEGGNRSGGSFGSRGGN